MRALAELELQLEKCNPNWCLPCNCRSACAAVCPSSGWRGLAAFKKSGCGRKHQHQQRL